MKFIDNITSSVESDLKETIKNNSKISITSSCFSLYAYATLKEELQRIDSLRFIFTSPTFIADKTPNANREFYIPRLNRERNLYGTPFELKLRNQLSQRAIAKECAEWIRGKVIFKSNITSNGIPNFLHIEAKNNYVYLPLNSFTTTNLGCNKGDEICNPVNRMETPFSDEYLKIFNNSLFIFRFLL